MPCASYAVSVDGTLYGFAHSPLGVLADNVRCLSPAGAADGVNLYRWCERTERWTRIRWPLHLWWVRLLLAAHEGMRGTRDEDVGHLRRTSAFLRWWIRTTDPGERVAFFRNPDLGAVIRRMRRRAVDPADGLRVDGFRGAARNMLRVLRFIRATRPRLLRPCEDDGAGAGPGAALAYGPERAAGALRGLLQDLGPAAAAAGGGLPYADVSEALLRRHGCLLEEALTPAGGRGGAEQRPVPPLPGWCVRPHRELGVSLVDYRGRTYVALHHTAALWQEYAAGLYGLTRRARVVFLDGPMQERRRIQSALRDGVPFGAVAWVADGSATVTTAGSPGRRKKETATGGDPVRANMSEELGVTAQTLAYFLRSARRTTPAGGSVWVEGIQHTSLRQQVDLLRLLHRHHEPRLVVLSGDSTAAGDDDVPRFDGWHLVCGGAERVHALDGVPGERFGDAPCGLYVWRSPAAAVGSGARDEWAEVDAVDAPPPGAAAAAHHRWMCAPVPNRQLVAWVCQNLRIPAGAMLVVRGRSDYHTLAKKPHAGALGAFRLCDGAVPFVGQDVRCVLGLARRLRFGEVCTVGGATAGGGAVVLRRGDGEVTVTREELRRHCRPARLSTIHEQVNSHYAARPVLVVLNHASGRRGRHADPLYTSVGLGGRHNVVVVANAYGFSSARADLERLARRGAAPPPLPPMWRDLMRLLIVR